MAILPFQNGISMHILRRILIIFRVDKSDHSCVPYAKLYISHMFQYVYYDMMSLFLCCMLGQTRASMNTFALRAHTCTTWPKHDDLAGKFGRPFIFYTWVDCEQNQREHACGSTREHKGALAESQVGKPAHNISWHIPVLPMRPGARRHRRPLWHPHYVSVSVLGNSSDSLAGKRPHLPAFGTVEADAYAGDGLFFVSFPGDHCVWHGASLVRLCVIRHDEHMHSMAALWLSLSHLQPTSSTKLAIFPRWRDWSACLCLCACPCLFLYADAQYCLCMRACKQL